MNAEVKRLYRSRTERMIGGVCGGLGDFLNVDVTLVRLLFIFGALFGGPGVLVYLVMLFVVPEEPLASQTVIDHLEGQSQ
jgi:phage shock protein C